MKQTINAGQFVDAFKECGRQDNFSYGGFQALYNFLEELSDDSGNEYELDVVELACEYTEYEDMAEFYANYDKDDYPDMESIRDATMVIDIPGSESFIIQVF